MRSTPSLSRNPSTLTPQELAYTPDPDDGMFWMTKEDAFLHFWTFDVCKVQTAGKIPPPVITDKKRFERAQKKNHSSGIEAFVGTFESSSGTLVNIIPMGPQQVSEP